MIKPSPCCRVCTFGICRHICSTTSVWWSTTTKKQHASKLLLAKQRSKTHFWKQAEEKYPMQNQSSVIEGRQANISSMTWALYWTQNLHVYLPPFHTNHQHRYYCYRSCNTVLKHLHHNIICASSWVCCGCFPCRAIPWMETIVASLLWS